jgi:hypothetical protein
MPESPSLKFGILKARDLVELYYGARMVANIVENSFPPTSTPAQLIGRDPRRISYELVLSEGSGAAFATVIIGSEASFDLGTGEQYFIPPGASIVVRRDFFTDLDAVALEVWVQLGQGAAQVSAREVFLTPIPADELP